MKGAVWFNLLAAPLLVSAPVTAWGADYLTVAEAQRVLVPQAQGFAPFVVTLSREQLAQIKKLSGVPQRTQNPKIWRGLKADGRTAGWVLVDEVIGKHEFITYAVGISLDGHVLGVEIMSYRESHGGEIRDGRWRSLFKGKSLADPFKLNKDIPNISGATLSSRNVTDGVKRLLAIHALALKDAG
jgi:Na+-translocating ferredoxin:NAD+ oxidoreductase RnfG subunit